jgi:hypothetical protein
MKTPATIVLAIALLGGCARSENSGYHGGTGAATLTLDLKPDGTWAQTIGG